VSHQPGSRATEVTPAQVRALVARTNALLRKGRLGALAIVTDSDFAFGMARMYQILAEPLPVQVGVFRTLSEATRARTFTSPPLGRLSKRYRLGAVRVIPGDVDPDAARSDVASTSRPASTW
jgi:hypothetical protein